MLLQIKNIFGTIPGYNLQTKEYTGKLSHENINLLMTGYKYELTGILDIVHNFEDLFILKRRYCAAYEVNTQHPYWCTELRRAIADTKTYAYKVNQIQPPQYYLELLFDSVESGYNFQIPEIFGDEEYIFN
jgi:hypothetical protein